LGRRINHDIRSRQWISSDIGDVERYEKHKKAPGGTAERNALSFS
jgi:hypothetical protein